MTDFDIDPDDDEDRLTIRGPDEWDITATCPHCDRGEDFDDGPSAQAWLSGHIQAEHDDELPKLANWGEDDDTDG